MTELITKQTIKEAIKELLLDTETTSNQSEDGLIYYEPQVKNVFMSGDINKLLYILDDNGEEQELKENGIKGWVRDITIKQQNNNQGKKAYKLVLKFETQLETIYMRMGFNSYAAKTTLENLSSLTPKTLKEQQVTLVFKRGVDKTTQKKIKPVYANVIESNDSKPTDNPEFAFTLTNQIKQTLNLDPLPNNLRLTLRTEINEQRKQNGKAEIQWKGGESPRSKLMNESSQIIKEMGLTKEEAVSFLENNYSEQNLENLTYEELNSLVNDLKKLSKELTF